MFCPNCKREVGGKKVFDEAVFLKVVLILIALVLAFTGVGLVVSIPCIICVLFMSNWRNAPLECPICRTRLVNPMGGDKKAFYATVAEAEGKAPPGLCRTCKHQNPPDGVYCARCGQKLIPVARRLND